MSASLPKILIHNIFHQFRRYTWAAPEDSSYPGSNACDWRYGKRWIPQLSGNVVVNGEMLNWTGATCDNWTLTGGGASLAKSTTTKIGPYSAAVTRAGADCLFEQTCTDFADFRGKKFTYGEWLYSTTANSCKVKIRDGVAAVLGGFHGGTGWEFLTTTIDVDQAASTLAYSYVVFIDGTVIGDGAALDEGSSVEQTPQSPQVAYLNAYPQDATGEIHIPNNYFKTWTDGPTEPPDSFDESGTDHVRLESSAPTLGRYRAEVVSALAVYRYLYHDITDDTTLASLLGHYGIASANAECAAANVGYIGLWYKASDGNWYELDSTFHTSAGNETWIDTTKKWIPLDATGVRVVLGGYNSASPVRFDSVRLVAGDSSITASTEPPDDVTLDTFCIADHNLFTAVLSAYLQSSADGSSWTTRATITPTSNKAAWKTFTEVTAAFWRVKVGTLGTGVGKGTLQAYIGVIAAGKAIELPVYPGRGWDPDKMKVSREVPLNRYGQPLGSQARQVPVQRRIELVYVDETFIAGDWADIKAHAGYPDALPYFLQWDDGDHDTQTFYCWTPPGYEFSEPRMASLACASLSFGFMAVQE